MNAELNSLDQKVINKLLVLRAKLADESIRLARAGGGGARMHALATLTLAVEDTKRTFQVLNQAL